MRTLHRDRAPDYKGLWCFLLCESRAIEAVVPPCHSGHHGSPKQLPQQIKNLGEGTECATHRLVVSSFVDCKRRPGSHSACTLIQGQRMPRSGCKR
eukprot:6460316-Amphidinium_carterae.2